jgi:hypothetical protein
MRSQRGSKTLHDARSVEVNILVYSERRGLPGRFRGRVALGDSEVRRSPVGQGK